MTFRTLVCLLAMSMPAIAHQPVVNEGKAYPVNAPLEIEEPEISKAFFAELAGDRSTTGSSAMYRFVSMPGSLPPRSTGVRLHSGSRSMFSMASLSPS